ncbi:MAG TPA: hypothetical protein VE153_26615, partial [Myxococcus sp.]|nr:hypothetical protein [Myxococcus sp.]
MAEKLGALLVRKGLITTAQLDEALKAQLIYGGRLGSLLIELDAIDIDTLAGVLGEQSRYPVAQDADFEEAADSVLALLTAAQAEKHLAFPLSQEGRRLKVAMATPMDMEHLDALGFITGLRIIPYVAPELRLFHFQAKRYGIQREARFIRIAPSERQQQMRASPPPAQAAAGLPVAAAPPPAPVQPAPLGDGPFGGLAPGQYLSDDADDGAAESSWASAAPAAPARPPEVQEGGAARVAASVQAGPPVLGARPSAPPQLAPSSPPQLASSEPARVA